MIFDLSSPGRVGFSLPEVDMDEAPQLDARYLRGELDLPEVSEIDMTRHFTRLSQKNYSIDTGFYPLGSCTMKYNPKVHEDVAIMPGFGAYSPLPAGRDGAGRAAGACIELQEMLAQIAGMDAVTLAACGGRAGRVHRHPDDPRLSPLARRHERDIILVPDSAHGTNPATAAAAGFKMVSLKSGARRQRRPRALEANLCERVAGMMLTVPNTLGLFEPNILKISEMVHKAGGLMYGDGANLNALVGHIRPGDLGFDVMHINLHKTFTTPARRRRPWRAARWPARPTWRLPARPVVVRDSEGENVYASTMPEKSIGRVKNFWGNFGMLVRAYTYIRHLGLPGLQRVSEDAMLNANYIRVQLKDTYWLPYDRICMHEVVLCGQAT